MTTPELSREETIKRLKEFGTNFQQAHPSITSAIAYLSSPQPEAKRERPEIGEEFFVINDTNQKGAFSWGNEDWDKDHLDTGTAFWGKNASERCDLEIRRRKLYRVRWIPKDDKETVYLFTLSGKILPVNGRDVKTNGRLLASGRICSTEAEAKEASQEEQEIAEEMIKLNG